MQIRLRDADRERRDLEGRLEAEKKLSRELRVENMRVKEDHLRTSTDSESQRAQIQDLRADIQRYVTQVQRIEGLLADKDVERRELLEQYKSLSDEMENSLAKARTVSVRLDAAQVWSHLLHCLLLAFCKKTPTTHGEDFGGSFQQFLHFRLLNDFFS